MQHEIKKGTSHESLGRVLNVDMDRRPPLWTVIRDRVIGRAPVARTVDLTMVLVEANEAGRRYFLKHGCYPALVIENVTELERYDQTSCDTLLAMAKVRWVQPQPPQLHSCRQRRPPFSSSLHPMHRRQAPLHHRGRGFGRSRGQGVSSCQNAHQSGPSGPGTCSRSISSSIGRLSHRLRCRRPHRRAAHSQLPLCRWHPGG